MPFVFNYTPHEAQPVILRARDRRFRTVCTGRRLGKTLCLAAEILDRGGCDPASPAELAQAGVVGPSDAGYAGARRMRDYGWIAPTYLVAERGIEAFEPIAGGFVKVCGRTPSRVEFEGAAGRARVWYLSSDNPDSVRGLWFQGLVLDEAAAIPGIVRMVGPAGLEPATKGL